MGPAGKKEAAEAVVVALAIAVGERFLSHVFDRLKERRERKEATGRDSRRPPGARERA